jgi:ribosomal protein S18 acetylase RimI-like enzyme
MPVVTALNPLPEQVVGVRAVVGAAFEHDPMLQWIFGGVEAAEHATAAWVGWFVEAFAAAGTVDVVLGSDGAPVAAALWRTDARPLPYPELPHLPGLMTAILGGRRANEVLVGLGAFGANKPDPPFHYLQFLAVHPLHQGTGLGRQLVVHGQERAAAAGQGVHLESTNPRNLSFYESLGFRLVGEFSLEPDGPPVWPLWWAPS